LIELIEELINNINISNFVGVEALKHLEELQRLFVELEVKGLHPLSVAFPNLPFGPPASTKKIRKEITTILTPFIKARRECKEEVDDLISVFAQTPRTAGPRKGQDYSLQEITQRVLSVNVAAHVNTASTMFWSLIDLYQNPVFLEKARKEVIEVIKEGKEFYQSSFFNQCAKETMRIHSFNLPMRKVKQDFVHEGYFIKAGALLAFPTVQNDEDKFVKQNSFNPDRWDTLGNSPSSFISFGLGLHRCKGDIYALQVVKSVAGLIVSDWDMEIHTNLENFAFNGAAKPTKKVMVSLKKRML